MKKISEIVSEIVGETPFLQEALLAGILNYRAAAKYLQSDIEKELLKSVKLGSIQMALMRYMPPNQIINSDLKFQNLDQLGSLQLITNLNCYTYKKSLTLLDLQSKWINKIGYDEEKHFYLFTYGFSECNLTN